jgi:hypothetical protein
MSRGADRTIVSRFILALLGVLISWVVASYAYVYFTQNGVTSDYATGYCIIVFLAVSLAFYSFASFCSRRIRPTDRMRTCVWDRNSMRASDKGEEGPPDRLSL